MMALVEVEQANYLVVNQLFSKNTCETTILRISKGTYGDLTKEIYGDSFSTAVISIFIS